MKKGSLLIDSSTIDPAVSKELAREAEKMGAVFMDAPVSGGESFPKHVFYDDHDIFFHQFSRLALKLISVLDVPFCENI